MPQMENTCNTLASDFWTGGGGGGVNLDLCAWAEMMTQIAWGWHAYWELWSM